ncbi:CdaR family transcriptional regulator [Petrocella sp. FN5]|uniref:CdaR family transcriptional regulator n=1 Tax=Petrocella sp. FN5 TaxID=3032002 RepID=UPI0023DBC508|nr:sugar diacid recognition domain-containing protein [Petrocella sp. FN5]MDF1616757.1 sugar diacid recognition domain-containing protein [Petrocella sp. FN5]
MSILEPALAQKFIEKTAKNLEFNINIMNDQGIIIASKDASRIGDFHEVASSMLNGTLDTGVVDENQKFLGTKPGVNMFIDYKNKHVGVICVTGNPENVKAFAGLVKTSMEAMLEYELQMEGERRRKNKAEQFLYYLLFNETVDFAVASKMAEGLELKKDILRVCILIKYDAQYQPRKMIEALTKAEGHSYQDIITVARNDDIILFKALSGDLQVSIQEYKELLDGYILSFIKKLPEGYQKDKICFFVGSLQMDINHFKESFVHAQELGLRIKADKGTYYFNEHVLDYYRSLATIKAYDNAFNIYDMLLSDDDQMQLVEIVDALYKNNYNVVYTAKDLFIHRNTLLFRLNKLKGLLNIDPVANASDREFLNELAYYFKHK